MKKRIIPLLLACIVLLTGCSSSTTLISPETAAPAVFPSPSAAASPTPTPAPQIVTQKYSCIGLQRMVLYRYGDYIYYINVDTDEKGNNNEDRAQYGLCRMKTDGSERVMLSNSDAYVAFGNTIREGKYLEAMYVEYVLDGRVYIMFGVKDNHLATQENEYLLCSVDMEGKDIRLETDESLKKYCLSPYGVSPYGITPDPAYLNQEWWYAVDQNTFNLVRVKMDGTGQETMDTGKYNSFWRNVDTLVLTAYAGESIEEGPPTIIRSFDIATGAKKDLCTEDTGIMSVFNNEDWIYYSTYHFTLKRMRIDGTGLETVREEVVSYYVIDDTIFFIPGESVENGMLIIPLLRRMDLDGKNDQAVDVVIAK